MVEPPPPPSMEFHQDPLALLELDSCGRTGADVLGLPHVMSPSDIPSLSTQKFLSGWVLLICKSVRFFYTLLLKSFAYFGGY